jgi:hypothetical protein
MVRSHQLRSERRSAYEPILAVAASLAIGVLVVKAPPIAFALAVGPAVILMTTRSPTVWVASAVIVAVTFRGLVELGLAPGYAQFAHVPLAWGALCVALIRGQQHSALAHRVGVWLGVLGLAVAASALLNHSEFLRGPAYLSILAEPFAIVLALLIEPPTRKERMLLVRTCFVLIAVQIPLAYFQAVTLGLGDSVQGTLYGSGAGAHVMAALVIVGAFWYVGRTTRLFSPIAIAVLAVMAGVLVMSDAKQVMFALPAALIGQRLFSSRAIAIGAIALALIYIVIHFQPLNSHYVVPYLDRAWSGETGKTAVAEMIWHEATADAGTFVFGQGPAATVSGAAYETVPAYQAQQSSLAALGLAPAQTAIDAEQIAAAVVRAKGKSAYNEPFALDSLDSGTSSGVGLFGDLGLLGFVVYSALFLTVFINLRRRKSAEGLAAASGFAMLIVLGFIHDWWEAPALTVLLGTLAAVSLTDPPPEAEVAEHQSSVDRSPSHRGGVWQHSRVPALR